MEYQINPREEYLLFRSPTGPSGRYLSEKGEEVRQAMIELITTSAANGEEYDVPIRTLGKIRPGPRGAVRAASTQGRQFPHVASAAGDAPRTWTGELIDSLKVTPPEQTNAGGSFGGMTLNVEADVDYAIYLEKGWGNKLPRGHKMQRFANPYAGAEPRPFMEPALDAVFEGTGIAHRARQ